MTETRTHARVHTARTHAHTHGLSRSHTSHSRINFQNLFGTLLSFVEKASTLAIILQFRDIAYRVVAVFRRYAYDFFFLALRYTSYKFILHVTR